MTPRTHKLLAASGLGTLALILALAPAAAQPPLQPQPVQPRLVNDDGTDVLARGPVHEAYASTAEFAAGGGEVAPKAPPEPIEELPPDQKPEGDNVQWIPGYWDWDDERADFVWISGFWRVPPPNRVWVPGSWRQVQGGWQWVHGFWQLTYPDQPAQPEIEYYPQPPAPIEVGPAIPAPDTTSVYVPGCWVWRERYVWRPGFWMPHRPGWVWTPACYRWTPAGYVFIDGYWDYPLAARGVLFAPVYFTRPVYVQPTYVFTPTYVVAEPVMVQAMFIRRGHCNYYFGDYFEARYAQRGFQAWCAPALPRGGFAFGIAIERRYHYDPLWSYYSIAHRDTPRWSAHVAEVYVGRYQGDIPRPPRTLVQQNTVIQNITNVTNVTNVTNNITVVNNNITVNNKSVNNVVMLTPLKVTPQLQPETRIQPIAQTARSEDAQAARQLRMVGTERTRTETSLVAQGRAPVPLKPVLGQPQNPAAQPIQPVVTKLDVPKSVVARSQVRDERKAPPPPPTQVRVNPKPVTPVTPVIPKGTDPRPVTPVIPKGTDPKPVTPVTPVKPVTPVVQPPAQPRPIVTPPTQPKPVTPVTPVNPVKPVTPVNPVVPPVAQPRPPIVQPPAQPRPIVPQPQPQPPKPIVTQPPVQPQPPKPVTPVNPVKPVTPVNPVVPPVAQPRQPIAQPPVQPRQPIVQPPVQPRQPIAQPPVQPRPIVQPPVQPRPIVTQPQPPKPIVTQPPVPPRQPIVQPPVPPRQPIVTQPPVQPRPIVTQPQPPKVQPQPQPPKKDRRPGRS